MQESRHIFIEHGLTDAASRLGNSLNVLEIGFGTGLNAALTLNESLQKGYTVQYTAVEKHPLPPNILMHLNYWKFLSQEQTYTKVISCSWNKPVQISANFSLNLLEGDVNAVEFPQNLQVVYYDAFAPQTAPDMWQPAIFERLHAAMAPGAVLVTFCAQGAFKRMLKTIGFTVAALPGPPGKREITRAVKPAAFAPL